MKKAIIALAAIIAFGCNKTKETPTMQGAYRMLSQIANDGKKDSVLRAGSQLKLYTPDFAMYAQFSDDSVSSFGIGSYTAEPGGIKENIIYGASDSSFNETPRSYSLAIEKTPNGYKQVIEGMVVGGVTYKLIEDYEALPSDKTSPLDGAWKLQKRYSVTGKDTVISAATEFKTYFAGRTAWGATYVDSLKQKHTVLGYGSFEMTGDNKVKETCEVCTFAGMRGASYDIDIELLGTDGFRQTIGNPNGTRDIEEYQRLKK